MGEFVKHGMSAHAIYEYFATGRGTGMLDDAQQATFAELQMESTRAWMIRKQGELIRSGWEGTASDGAYGAAAPLAEYASDGVDLLGRAQDLLDRQSGSYHRAANSVTPVPEEPPSIDLSDPMVAFTDYDAQIKEYQSQTHHNLDVYGVYDEASEYNQTNMPGEYSTVNHAGGGNITVTDTKPSDTSDYIEVPEREQPRNGGETGPYDNPSGPSGPGPGGSPVSGPPPMSGPVPNPSQPQQTSPSTYVPPAIDTPGQFPPGQSPYQPTPGTNPPGYVSGVPVGAGPGSSPGARGGSGGYGPRGGGYNGGQGGSPGGAGARGAMPGPGGAAAGALAAEEAAARRAAAAAASARGGAAGGMAGAPLGGGRGQGNEDEEHKRKVLIETDAESVFGSDVLTAPQVIGDDEYEDD